MKDKLLHTPEGVRDIYSYECRNKIKLQDDLHKVLEKYGFQDIQTPSFEFFDIFNQERGTISSKDLYKFFDRDGNTLVLRPDITPSIARCVAKYYKEETMPIRLSYIGNTFINNISYQGKLKEVTQLGAELINDNSVEADAEMIALTIESLLKSGLTDFQLDIGEADFFRALIDEAGFDEKDDEAKFRELMEHKNIFATNEFIKTQNLDKNLKELLTKLPELFGNYEILQLAKSLTNNDRALKSIERLEKIYDLMKDYNLEQYVSFDLGMLSKYDYYTGIIFKAYTYSTGEAVASGGRYDNLVSQFGKDASAIGLVIVVDHLMIALSRQKLLKKSIRLDTLIMYEAEYRKSAIELAKHFRDDDINIILQLLNPDISMDEYIEYSKRSSIGGILLINNNDEITVINIETGEKQIAKASDFLLANKVGE